MEDVVGVAIASENVAILVHPCEPIKSSAGEINGGELAVAQQIAVAHASGIQIPADNVAASVDSRRVGVSYCTWGINGSDLAITQKEAMNNLVGRLVDAGDVTLRVDSAERG